MKIKTYKLLLVLGLALSLVNLVSADFKDNDLGSCWGGMGAMMTGNYGFGTIFFSWIFSILVIVALILLIVWLIKQIQKK